MRFHGLRGTVNKEEGSVYIGFRHDLRVFVDSIDFLENVFFCIFCTESPNENWVCESQLDHLFLFEP